LKVLLLMWSSPAALVKVKLSASRLSTGPQSFCSQAAYHFRAISSFVKFCPPDALALAGPSGLTAPTSAQAPVASRFLRASGLEVREKLLGEVGDEALDPAADGGFVDMEEAGDLKEGPAIEEVGGESLNLGD
jgi:hypothetical protein